MSGPRSISRKAVLESLSDFRDFVASACRDAGLEESVEFDLSLAVDEACTNIITHGATDGRTDSITLTFEWEDPEAVVTIHDRSASFSPDAAPKPDLEAGWRERQVGGLGWHLIRGVVDEIDYRSDPENGNTLTLVKRPSSNSTNSTRP